MTKLQFIYLVKTFFEGSDGGGGGAKRWHTGDIEQHIDMAFADAVEQLYRQAISFHDWGHIDPLAKNYSKNNAVWDDDRCEYEVKLPAIPIHLPENAGIRMVYLGNNQKKILTYTVNNSAALWDEIEKYDGLVTNSYSFYIEGNSIWIGANKGDIDKVGIKLIPSFTDYDDEDNVSVSFGKGNLVFDMVTQRMAQIFASDEVNDGSSKKINVNG